MTSPLIVFALTDQVLWYLTEGPATIGALAQRAGVPRREVEEALQSIATSGRYGLVADGHGVRLTNDADAIHEYVESLRRRMAAMYRRVCAQRAVERRLRGYRQMELAL